MSDFIPRSSADDGLELDPHIPTADDLHLGRWAGSFRNSSSAPDTAVDFYDDGADLCPPSREPGAPGFGMINPDFHKQARKKKHEKEFPTQFQDAVTADIRETLRDIKHSTTVHLAPEVKRKRKPRKEEREGPQDIAAGERIQVPVSKKRVSFVVHGENGQVVIIDNEGAVMDSSPIHQVPPPPPRRIRDKHVKNNDDKSEGQRRFS